jgi:hypothetical protein
MPIYADKMEILSSHIYNNIMTLLKSNSVLSELVIKKLYRSAMAFDELALQMPVPEEVEGVINFFFANFQPEATTSPMCGIWADHINFLNAIAQNLNFNDIVVYREHPLQFKFLPLMNRSSIVLIIFIQPNLSPIANQFQ